MKEARNLEESDKMIRSCNIILHGIKEANIEDKEEAKKIDEAYVISFLNAIRTPRKHLNTFLE